MAVRPLALGMRFVDRGREVRLTTVADRPARYAVAVRREGGDDWKRQHPTLAAAVAEFAAAWRERLN